MAWLGALQYYTGLWQPNMHEVVPQLWLGNLGAAFDKKTLRAYGITHIVSVTNYGSNVAYYPLEFKYCVLTADDHPTFQLSTLFKSSNEFIASALQQGGTILIHCKFGRSRSATILAAFLIAHLQFTPMAAFAKLRTARPIVCPNPGFITQTYQWAIQTGCFNPTGAEGQTEQFDTAA